ncbi:MAG: ATP-binding protein [Anaerolineae bacterium]|nr:ATP-binding protein [Anaerolineae bacterium]
MSKNYLLEIPAHLNNLQTVRDFVREKAAGFNLSQEVLEDVILAVNEAATNVIVHGYKEEQGIIQIEIRGEETGGCQVCIRDEAPLFDPTRIPTPDLSLPLEKRPFGGMGVHLIRSLMDEVKYNITIQGNNELTLVIKQKEDF